MLTRIKRERDERLARLRKNKRKLAIAKARGHRQDIVAVPRLKDANYPLELRSVV